MRRYLVTGATSGVGLEVANALAEQGHVVTVVGRNVDRLKNLYPDALSTPAKLVDFTQIDPEAVSALVRSWAPFDGIFHAAGAEMVHALRMTTDEHYRHGMAFADSSFAILRAAASKGTMKDGGSIVVMSSVAATRATPGMAVYGAARAAVEAMVRTAALELAPRRIRASCVAAGAFITPMHGRITKKMMDSAVKEYEAKHPLGFGMVSEVRDAVLYLLSDAARWSTGAVMVVDGGYLAG